MAYCLRLPTKCSSLDVSHGTARLSQQKNGCLEGFKVRQSTLLISKPQGYLAVKVSRVTHFNGTLDYHMLL
jgi:hypothetical protein